MRLESHKEKYERRKREVMKEWDEAFPNAIYILDNIFKDYGLISPWEYLDMLLGERETMLKGVERVNQLLKHAKRMLWSFINRVTSNKSIREILRGQIKVIDDEELVFAF